MVWATQQFERETTVHVLLALDIVEWDVDDVVSTVNVMAHQVHPLVGSINDPLHWDQNSHHLSEHNTC